MEEDKVVDLMAALEASVKSAKEARRRHPGAAHAAAEGAAGDGDAPKAAAPAKKRTRKSA
jgi:hypothetical protein